MANRIAAFFEAMPVHQEAVTGIAQHVKRYWEPRMRRKIFEHLDGQGGAGLHPMVVEALRTQRETLQP